MTHPNEEPWGDPASKKLYSPEALRKEHPEIAALLDEMVADERVPPEEIKRIYDFATQLDGQSRWMKLGGNAFSLIVIVMILSLFASACFAAIVKVLSWGFS